MNRVGFVCASFVLFATSIPSPAIEQYERGTVASFVDSLQFCMGLCLLKVGLLGLGRSLQKDLNRIAETADTSTSQGLHYVLTGNLPYRVQDPFNSLTSWCWMEKMQSVIVFL